MSMGTISSAVPCATKMFFPFKRPGVRICSAPSGANPAKMAIFRTRAGYKRPQREGQRRTLAEPGHIDSGTHPGGWRWRNAPETRSGPRPKGGTSRRWANSARGRRTPGITALLGNIRRARGDDPVLGREVAGENPHGIFIARPAVQQAAKCACWTGADAQSPVFEGGQGGVVFIVYFKSGAWRGMRIVYESEIRCAT